MSRRALATAPIAIGTSPALIVVDAIKGFTDPSCPLGGDFTPEVAVIGQLLQVARANRWPVVFSTVVYHSDDQASVFRAKVPALNLLTPGSQWVEVDERLARQNDDMLLEKTHASCFHGTTLAQSLRQRGIDSVLVTGFTTSGCVRATAVDALQYDFRTFVVKDAVADRDPEAHEANLYDLQAKYGELIDSRGLIERYSVR